MKIVFGALACLFSFSLHATLENGFNVIRENKLSGEIAITGPTQIICNHGGLTFAPGTRLLNKKGYPLYIECSDMSAIQMGENAPGRGLTVVVGAPSVDAEEAPVDRTLLSVVALAYDGMLEVEQEDDALNRAYYGIVSLHFNGKTNAGKNLQLAKTTILDEGFGHIPAIALK